MDILRQQIRRARVRLLVQSVLGKLAWCWFVTLAVAAVAIGAAKYWPPVDERAWNLTALAIALAAGALAATVWAWITRENWLAVASEIDRRFGLKERVSSTVSLSADELQSPIGRALLDDAVKRVERIDLPHAFGVRLTRAALLPLLPAVAAVVLAVFVSSRVMPTPAVAASDTVQTKKMAEALAKKIEERRKSPEAAGLAEADALLLQLEQGAKELGSAGEADRKQMLKALNDMARDAEKRRQQLAGSTDLKQQLNQLKNMQQGPAQKMASAMKNGDLKKAIDELETLKDKLLSDKLTALEKEQLAKQLEQMKQALDKTVEAHKQAAKDLKQQLDREMKAGNTEAAEKLQQQLDKLAQKSEQMDKISQMSAELKKAGEAMKAGDSKKTADALARLSEDLGNMARQMDELSMLDSALEDLSDWKNATACKECDGEGCAACQGEGNKPHQMWSRSDFARGGRGPGAGKRDKKDTDAGFVDSQVPQNVGRGAMVVKGTADGPNRKGQVQQAIKEEFSGAAQQSAEALTDQRLPHAYRDHAKGYFEALREGQK